MPRTWMKLGIGLVAVALAVAAGTGVYAMRGDDPHEERAAANNRDDARRDAPIDGGSLAMCVAGVTDCQDTIVEPEGGIDCDAEGCESEPGARCIPDSPCARGEVAGCPADDPACVATAFQCPPNAECQAPMPPVCADVQPEICGPGGFPSPYECVLLETDPPITACKPICVEPMPLPDVPPAPPEPRPEPSGAEPTAPQPAEQQLLPCGPFDPCLPQPLAPGAPEYEEAPCPPPCATRILPAEEIERYEEVCLPPDCTISSDGVVACPAPTPCEDTPDANARCLPPDCAVSSDGSFYCEPVEGGGGGSSGGGIAPSGTAIAEPVSP